MKEIKFGYRISHPQRLNRLHWLLN